MTDEAATTPEPANDSRGRGARFWILAIIIAVAVIVAGVLIYQASFSAFTAQTGTGSSSFSTGSVSLTNDSEGTAVFTAEDLSPGSSDSADITVTYTGSLDSEVRLYAEVTGATQTLADHLDFTISTPDGAATPWTGTLTEFQALSDFASGILGLTMSTDDTAVYTVEWEVADTAPQNAEADVTFVWEAQEE